MNRAELDTGLRRYVAVIARQAVGTVEAADVDAAYREARKRWPVGELGIMPWRAASRGLKRRMEEASTPRS